MDAFEGLVSEILWRKGYWTKTSFRVELSKEEKRKIGRPSSPRWELDVVGYGGRKNEILVVECKSYLDSGGVSINAFNGRNKTFAQRFKLFNDNKLRKVVFERLSTQLYELGLSKNNPKVKLCLACGRIASDSDRTSLHKHFKFKGWELWDESWLRDELSRMSKTGYENETAAVVAKLLLR